MVYNTYDGFGRLATSEIHKDGSTTNASYAYNGDDLRMSKTVDGEITKYVLDRGSVLKEVTSQGTKSYMTGLSYISSSDGQNYLANAHGDIMQIIANNGSILNSYEYDAFGVVTAASETVQNSIKYAGEFTDEETGYIYLRARYYEPNTLPAVGNHNFIYAPVAQLDRVLGYEPVGRGFLFYCYGQCIN